MSSTILVVEDDREINELVSEYLALENIHPVQATNGRDGMRMAGELHPDAVVLDLMLPDVHGFEVARTLSMHRATHDIPIVILSCMCQECDRSEGFHAGALHFMNKPFLPDDLLMRLRQAVEWKQGLKTRQPLGQVVLGAKDSCTAARGINEMVADIFTRTDLSDEAVAEIREGVELVGKWAGQWNQEHHSETQLRLEYQVNSLGGGEGDLIEWKLSETAPGLLAETFFKPAAAGPIGGLIGWGASALMAKAQAPATLPVRWMQLLDKLGGRQFERDVKTQTVRFSRPNIGAVEGMGSRV